MIDTTTELTQARDLASNMAHTASTLVDTLDRLIKETPSDLPAILDQIKERLVTEMAKGSSEFDRSLSEYDATAASRTEGTDDEGESAQVVELHGEGKVMCPVCDKELLNETGLMIHLGRAKDKPHQAESKKRHKARAAAV